MKENPELPRELMILATIEELMTARRRRDVAQNDVEILERRYRQLMRPKPQEPLLQ